MTATQRAEMAARESSQDAHDMRVMLLRKKAESGPGAGTFAAFGLGAFLVFKALFSSPQT
jgi:hypothetical protein